MKKYFFLLLSAAIAGLSVNAKIRRVGFFASPVSGTDYSTFALAYTAANAGDTILMFPATSVGATISKKLIIIGPGNFLDPTSVPKGNANQQAFAGEATLGSITLAPGSDGTVIMGLRSGTVYIQANNITVMRNRDVAVTIASNSPAINTTNIQVLQNFNLTFSNYYTNACSVTNINVSNNLMNSFSTAPGNTYSGNIANNVWAYDNVQTAANADGGVGTVSIGAAIELGGGAYLFQNNIVENYYNATLAGNYNVLAITNAGNTVFNYNLALQTGSGPARWPSRFGRRAARRARRPRSPSGGRG